MRPAHWLLPWASPGGLADINGLVCKGAHLTDYAILAALWYRAFTRGCRLTPTTAGWLAFGISLAWATLDEWHQAFLPSRTSSATDVGIDGAGAAVALIVACRGWRAALDGATSAVLWLASAGGAVAIAINAWAGVPSGPPWVTTPPAAVVMLLPRRLPRPKPAPQGEIRTPHARTPV